MSRLLQYPLEQWDVLVAAPWMAAAAVITGDRSGTIGTEREVDTARDLISRAADAGSQRSDLVCRVAAELRDDHDLDPPPGSIELNWEVALDRLRRVNPVLDELASNRDASEFRSWLYEVAEAVAGASREGFAGLGPRVSRNEESILREIRRELHLDDGRSQD